MNSFKFISEITGDYPKEVCLSVLLYCLVGASSAMAFLTMAPMIDFFLASEKYNVEYSSLTQKFIIVFEFFKISPTAEACMILFLVVVTLSCLAMMLAKYWMIKLRVKVLRYLIADTYTDIFSSRLSFFYGKKSGFLFNAINNETAVVGNAFTLISNLSSKLFLAIFAIIVPFVISFEVTAISLICALLFLLPFHLLGKVCYKLGQDRVKMSNKVASFLQQHLMAAKLIMGFGKQFDNIKDFNRLYGKHLDIVLKSNVLKEATTALYIPFIALTVVIALLLARQYGVKLSEITVLLVAIRQATLSLNTFIGDKNKLATAYPSYLFIKKLCVEAQNNRQPSGQKEFHTLRSAVTLKNVTFAYEGHKPVIEGLNLTIKKGEMTALVGKSGVGKSTITDLIVGYHHPQAGQVLIDDENLSSLDIISYRQKIGIVPQESLLLNLTIKENILWANPQASDKEIDDVIQLSYVSEFIDQLPKGLDTLVGERGIRLSGGQIQRVAIARALIRKPEILILDEATSALDTKSEVYIQKAIENIAKQTTIIVVAHRISTIKNADKIVVLEKGRIVDAGRYDDVAHLLNDPMLSSAT